MSTVWARTATMLHQLSTWPTRLGSLSCPSQEGGGGGHLWVQTQKLVWQHMCHMTFDEILSLGFQTLNNWLRQRLGADNNQDPVDALASYLHSEAISFLKLGFHQDCEELRVLYTQFSVWRNTTLYLIQGLQGNEEHLRNPRFHWSDTTRQRQDIWEDNISEQGPVWRSHQTMSKLMVPVLFVVQCCALNPETIQELDSKLEYFVGSFTSNITKSHVDSGLQENVYAPQYRNHKKVEFSAVVTEKLPT